MRVIVRFNHGDQSKWDASLAATGALVHQHFKNTQAVAAEMSPGAVKQLANDPGIAYISVDRPLAAKQKSHPSVRMPSTRRNRSTRQRSGREAMMGPASVLL